MPEERSNHARGRPIIGNRSGCAGRPSAPFIAAKCSGFRRAGGGLERYRKRPRREARPLLAQQLQVLQVQGLQRHPPFVQLQAQVVWVFSIVSLLRRER